MSSSRQRKKGYPLPENEFEEETASYCITIPTGYEYFKAMESQLQALGLWWMWKRSDDRMTAASDTAMTWRSILTIEENCGGDMATQEDIAKGMYQAMNWLALQIASGSYQNVNIVSDEDGVVTLPSGDDPNADLPEDDPATSFDETEAARYGAMVQIAAKLELVLDKIDTLYGVDVAPDTTEQNAQATMKAYFPSDATLMDAAVTSYYSWRTIPNNQFVFNGGTSFPQYLYCNGYSLNAIARYFLDVAAYPITKQQVVGYLFAALSDEFFSENYSIGVKVPSNSYLEAACVPMPYQEYLDVPYASPRTLLPTVAKASHRLLITVSGYYTDPDGDLQDAFWYRTAAGVLTRSNFSFTHGAGSNMPSDVQVVYNSAHVYEYTIDLSSSVSSWSIQFNKHANMAVASSSPTNGFSLTITDLGLAVSQ